MAMIRGPIAWAKITGKPQPGYTKSQLEWSFDLGLDKAAIDTLTALGCESYIKPVTNPKTGKDHVLGVPYIKFTRREYKANGDLGAPIRVVDAKQAPWPENKRIGNGSIANVKFAVNPNQLDASKQKPSVVAVQIWQLEEYEGGEEFPVSEGEETW